MKYSILLIFSFLFSFSLLAQEKYIPGAYKIDPVTEMTINSTEGSLPQLDGQIDLQEKFEDSRIVVFDTSAESKMKLVSTGISGTLEKFNLKGDLTLNGTTKQVVFDMRYIGIVADGRGTNKVAFIGQTKIYRENGEEISLDLRMLATRPSKSTQEAYEAVYQLVK